MAEAWYSGYSGRIDYVSDLGMAKGSLESVIINPLLAWAIEKNPSQNCDVGKIIQDSSPFDT